MSTRSCQVPWLCIFESWVQLRVQSLFCGISALLGHLFCQSMNQWGSWTINWSIISDQRASFLKQAMWRQWETGLATWSNMRQHLGHTESEKKMTNSSLILSHLWGGTVPCFLFKVCGLIWVSTWLLIIMSKVRSWRWNIQCTCLHGHPFLFLFS